MQGKNRLHVVLLKSCKSLKEGLIKIYLLRWLFLWLEACLFKNSVQFRGSSHPAPQQHKVFLVLFRALNGKYQPFIPPYCPRPLKIELKVWERYMITSQCRAWIPVQVSRRMRSRSPFAEEQLTFSLEPRAWAINLILSGFGGQICHSAQPSHKRGHASKAIYEVCPEKVQPLLI